MCHWAGGPTRKRLKEPAIWWLKRRGSWVLKVLSFTGVRLLQTPIQQVFRNKKKVQYCLHALLWERLTDWNNLFLHTPVTTGDRLQLVENMYTNCCFGRRRHLHFLFQFIGLCFHVRTSIQWCKNEWSAGSAAELVRGFLQLCDRSNGIWILTVPQLSLCFCSVTTAAAFFFFFDAFWLFVTPSYPMVTLTALIFTSPSWCGV